MAERDLIKRAERGVDATQRGESLVFQRLFDGAQPVGALRVAGRRRVGQAGRMRNQKRRHEKLCLILRRKRVAKR
jgi:hypothetical protein